MLNTILTGQCRRSLQLLASDVGASSAAELPQLLEAAYTQLARGYRWEYIYKNELTRWVLAQAPEAAVLYELRAGNCLVDCVAASGRETVAYEIKTELDNLSRLATQTTSYAGIYDRTYVVTHAPGVPALQRHLRPEVGVLVLDAQLVLHEERPASSTPFEAQEAVFVLRQSELVEAHQRLAGALPVMGTACVWEYCQRFYLDLPGSTAHQVFREALQRRAVPPAQRQLYAQAPPSLGVALLRRPLPARQCKALAALLTPVQ